MIYFDSQSGQPSGTYEVRLENGNLVFEYSSEYSTMRRAPEGSDEYLELANLVKQSGTSRQVMADGHSILFADYADCPEEDVLQLAHEIGPLFGKAGISETEDAISEPVDAWISAAQVLNLAVRAEAFTGKPERFQADTLDASASYEYAKHKEGSLWQAFYGLRQGIPLPYAYTFALSEEESALLAAPISCRDGLVFDGSLLYGSNPDAPMLIATTRTIQGVKGDALETHPFTAAQLRAQDMEPSAEQLNVAQGLAETLVQLLVSVHTMHCRLGWGMVAAKGGGREYASIGVQFNTYLEHLWYSFGLRHSGGKLGVCAHCGMLFSAYGERKSTKRYCSYECQNRAKAARSEARKKAHLEEVRQAAKQKR